MKSRKTGFLMMVALILSVKMIMLAITYAQDLRPNPLSKSAELGVTWPEEWTVFGPILPNDGAPVPDHSAINAGAEAVKNISAEIEIAGKKNLRPQG